MADLIGRSDFEKALASAVGTRLDGSFKKLMSYLDPDNPSMSDIPASFWQSLGADSTKEIQPKLATVFLQAGKAIASSAAVAVPGGIDWTLINKAASEWAKRYTFELVKGINETTVNQISQGISEFFSTPGATIGDLRDGLAETFGPVRAAMIASTEVTRASVQGELNMVNVIEDESHLNMIPTWLTDRDDLVCDLCGPRDGKGPDEWDTDEYPPLHVNCRCDLAWAPEGWT